MRALKSALLAGLLVASAVVPALVLGATAAKACALCGTYRVVDMAPGDVLHMRARPRAGATVVGVIPGEPEAAEHAIVKSGPCRRGWCMMSYGNQTGWVRMRFLAIIR